MNKEESPERSALLKTMRLLALLALNRMKLKEQVSVMSRAGFDRNEIAGLLGTTPNSVSVRLNELKKEAISRVPVSCCRRCRCSPKAAKPAGVFGISRCLSRIRVWARRTWATCCRFAMSIPTRSRSRLVRRSSFSSRKRLIRIAFDRMISMGLLPLLGLRLTGVTGTPASTEERPLFLAAIFRRRGLDFGSLSSYVFSMRDILRWF